MRLSSISFFKTCVCVVCGWVCVHVHACGGQRLLVSSLTALTFSTLGRVSCGTQSSLILLVCLAAHPWDPLYLPLKPWVLLQAFNGVLRIWGSSLHACVAILYQHWATSPDHHWICLYWQYWQVSSPVRTMSPGRSTSRFRLYSRQMRHPWGLITDTT